MLRNDFLKPSIHTVDEKGFKREALFLMMLASWTYRKLAAEVNSYMVGNSSCYSSAEGRIGLTDGSCWQHDVEREGELSKRATTGFTTTIIATTTKYITTRHAAKAPNIRLVPETSCN